MGAGIDRRPPGAGAVIAGTGSPLSSKASDLMPTRPHSTESQADDWFFEIVWTVELVEPERGRQAENGARIKEMPPEPAPQASADTETE